MAPEVGGEAKDSDSQSKSQRVAPISSGFSDAQKNIREPNRNVREVR
jgi:hypothetical protein